MGGQLAGTPSVMFDAVTIILSNEGAKSLSMEATTIDFVRYAYGRLKAIGEVIGGNVLVKSANIHEEVGVMNTGEIVHLFPHQKLVDGIGKN